MLPRPGGDNSISSLVVVEEIQGESNGSNSSQKNLVDQSSQIQCEKQMVNSSSQSEENKQPDNASTGSSNGSTYFIPDDSKTSEIIMDIILRFNGGIDQNELSQMSDDTRASY